MALSLFPGIPLAAIRLRLRAREPLRFPPSGIGAALRGAFGWELKRLVCAFDPRATPCGPCTLRKECAYPRTFEPGVLAPAGAPKRLQDPPRPFVLKPPLDGRDLFRAGEAIEWTIVLAGPAIVRILPYLVVVWEALGREGIGARPHGRFDLEAVTGLDLADGGAAGVELYAPAERRVLAGALHPVASERVEEALAARLSPGRTTVRFLTPTDLRSGGRPVERPAFHHLVRRLLTRLSAIATFHGPGAPALDYRVLGEKSEAVRTVSIDVRRVERSRRAAHTGAVQPLSGIVGEATYEGELAPFLPLLALGSVLHVGKECAFGNGWIEAI